LRVVEKHTNADFNILITDVVMPHMGGKELAERLSTDYHGLKVLYMSGYTDDAIVHDGILNVGINFIQKPFSPAVLAETVRKILDES